MLAGAQTEVTSPDQAEGQAGKSVLRLELAQTRFSRSDFALSLSAEEVGAAAARTEGPLIMASSPGYIPEIRAQVAEPPRIWQAGGPSGAAEEMVGPSGSASPIGADFCATHEPVVVTQPQEPVDVMEAFVRPLHTLLGDLHFSVDADLGEFRGRITRTRIASFQRDALEFLRGVSNPGELKEFIDFCQEELKSFQARGVQTSNFAAVLALLSSAQAAWSHDESETRPRPPYAQIAAVEGSARELRRKFAHSQSAIAADEGHLHSLAQEEASVRADLAAKEAQLSELEMAIRSLREKLASVCGAREMTFMRVEDHREEAAREERELEALAAESQALRMTTVEASAEALQRYAHTSELMQAIQRDLLACIERLGDP